MIIIRICVFLVTQAASSSTVISRLVSGSEDPAVIPSNDPQHKS